MIASDHEIDFLISLDGFEFQMVAGYVIKIEARMVSATKERPQGVKYSLTLHDPAGQRIYGMDNAHGTRRRTAFDHRHLYGRRKMVGYKLSQPFRIAGRFLC